MQFVFGIIIGFVFCAVIIWKVMPNMMIINKQSKLSFEDTVEEIQKLAKGAGWSVPYVYNMKQSFEKAGNENVAKMHVVSLGNAGHAYGIVNMTKIKKYLHLCPIAQECVKIKMVKSSTVGLI